jgi:hypothetical protein
VEKPGDSVMREDSLIQAGRKAGHTFSQPDLIIAATGLHHGFTAAPQLSQQRCDNLLVRKLLGELNHSPQILLSESTSEFAL